MNGLMSKITPYFPAVIFGLLLISPLIPTGLPIKKYTHLNEILLMIIVLATLANHVIQKNSFSPLKIEILILSIGISLTVSNFFGYLFLDVPLGWIDFYQVFNVLLFACYFRLGTFFDYEKIQNSTLIILFLSILCLNLLSISQLYPWGFHNILPLYMPAGMIKTSGYEMVFQGQGTIGRIVGIISSPTSFSIIMVIIALLLAGWILYIPIRKIVNKTIIHLLLIFSVFVLLLTFARAGLLAFFVSFMFFLGVACFVEKKKIFGLVLSIILAFLLYFSSNTLLGKDLLNLPKASLRGYRVAHIFTAQEEGSYIIMEEPPATTKVKPPATTDVKISDFENRVALWKMGLKKAMISPVFGWGIGNTSALEARRLGLDETVRGFYGSHSEYIELTIQTGIVGLILIISFFVLVFRKATQIVKTNFGGFQHYIARSVQAIIIALAVFSLFDGFWNNNITPPILMIVFGSMYADDKTSCSQE